MDSDNVIAFLIGLGLGFLIGLQIAQMFMQQQQTGAMFERDEKGRITAIVPVKVKA